MEMVVGRNQVSVREIGIITEEIKELRQGAQRMALYYAVEIGRRLEEAKSVLPHGEWGTWLRDEVEFSQSTANNFMKLFAEYGASQISIFGAVVNSQTLENLPYSKALALLAVPSEEREAFAEEVDAEHLSVRALEKAIRERDDSREELEGLKKDAEAAFHAAKEANRVAKEKAKEAERLATELDGLQKKAKKLDASLKKANEALAAALNDPKLPKEKLDAIRAEAEKAARDAAEISSEKALAELRDKEKEAQASRMAAELRAAQAEEALDAARKRLKTASPETAAFKVHFEALQREFAACRHIIEVIGGGDPETAEKLMAAMKRAVEIV